jgi:hypothetical protein
MGPDRSLDYDSINKAIDALNGWNQVGTTVSMTGSSVGLTADVATNQQIPIVMSVSIPAGQTYGFCIISSNTVIYTTYATTMPATVSNSDIFCDKNDSLKLAELLNARVKEFDWTFHNPMHFPWSQKEFHDWLLSGSQYGTEE